MSDDANVSMEVFWKLHEGLPKQGPGSDPSTRRALGLVPNLPDEPRILDIACGPGRQTLVLAADTGGHVTAFDLLPPFLAQVDERAREAGLTERITTAQGLMTELDRFEDAAFDLVWSEGAIYIIGFEKGLRAWQRLLAPGGTLAVTEATWLVDNPPDRIQKFWDENYPAMQSHAANLEVIERTGYTLVESFVLSEQEWWDDYYALIEPRIAALRKERSDPAWVAALDAADHEAEIVRTCKGSYGYVFYVMQK